VYREHLGPRNGTIEPENEYIQIVLFLFLFFSSLLGRGAGMKSMMKIPYTLGVEGSTAATAATAAAARWSWGEGIDGWCCLFCCGGPSSFSAV
jgi:hypothetical protein